MNKLIMILLVMVLGVSCKSQDYKVRFIGSNRHKITLNDSISIEADLELSKYVTEFIDDYLEHGYSKEELNYFSKDLMGVYIDHLEYGKYGTTFYQQPYGKDYIIISPIIRGNTKKLRLVVYHELGHIYLDNIEHCHKKCNQIFSAILGYDNFYNDWENQKKIFFNRKQH